MKIKITCPICKEIFFVEENRLKHGRGKYCSRKCKYLALKEKDTRIDVKCAYCKKNIKRYKSSIKSKYVFCSNECSYKARSIGLVKRIINKPYNITKPSTLIEKKCPICNNEFKISPARDQDKNRGKYCSRNCFEKAHKENMKGDKNPSWIDGRSYNNRGYRGEDWKEIRNRVYKRDNYNCQDCGKKCRSRLSLNEKNGHLLIQCHHIDRNKSNNNLDNLETLCSRCHGKKWLSNH